jgi:hypothetical protein
MTPLIARVFDAMLSCSQRYASAFEDFAAAA